MACLSKAETSCKGLAVMCLRFGENLVEDRERFRRGSGLVISEEKGQLGKRL